MPNEIDQAHVAGGDKYDVPPVEGEALPERIVNEEMLGRTIHPLDKLRRRQNRKQRLIHDLGFNTFHPKRALQGTGLLFGKIFDQDAEGVVAKDVRVGGRQTWN